MKLHHMIHHPSLLTPMQQERMFELFSTYYDCVCRQSFDVDLLRKTSVILLLDETEIIRGFSTQEIYDTQYDGETIRILFSGDTIVEPQCWGSQELVRGWCAIVARMLKDADHIKCYWFLISKGYRTYLYLPIFFKKYCPDYEGLGSELKPLLAKIAAEKFPTSYNENLGLIRFDSSQGHLRSNLCDVPKNRMENVDVIYFLERNPDYADGVELACLAEISIHNTHGLGKRLLRQAIAELS